MVYDKLTQTLIDVWIDSFEKDLQRKSEFWKALIDEPRTVKDKRILLYKAKDAGKPDSHT